MYLVYSALLFVFLVVSLPSIAYARWRRGKALGSVAERFGRLPVAVNPEHRSSIWIHAVSVGEALAARALVVRLRDAYPDHRLIMSTTTATGQEVARGVRDPPRRDLLRAVRPPAVRRGHPRSRRPRRAHCRQHGDLAQPPAGVPTPRRQDGAGQRAYVRPVVSRVQDGAMVHATGARRPGSHLCADENVESSVRRPRRRPGAGHGDREPQVRYTGRDRGRRGFSRRRPGVGTLPAGRGTAGGHRRKHPPGRGGAGAASVRGRPTAGGHGVAHRGRPGTRSGSPKRSDWRPPPATG